MATAPGEVGAAPSLGDCACLRRELSGEPDVGNLHLRFDEGRAGRANASPTLLLYRLSSRGAALFGTATVRKRVSSRLVVRTPPSVRLALSPRSEPPPIGHLESKANGCYHDVPIAGDSGHQAHAHSMHGCRRISWRSSPLPVCLLPRTQREHGWFAHERREARSPEGRILRGGSA
jgi:hypothetical protein